MEVLTKFKEICSKYSDSIALKFADQFYTYRQIDLISDTIAYNLYTHGVQGSSRIGLFLDRNDKSILIILGILKFGCIYVPLSKENPRKRTQYMAELAGIDFIICDEEMLGISARYINCDLLFLEQLEESNIPIIRNRTLYTIFTSGSTGKPKAFDITQAAMINLVTSLDQRNWPDNASEHNVVGELAELVFDMSQAQIYLALLTGRTLDIIPSDVKMHPRKLAQYLQNRKITHCDITPTLLEVYIDYIIRNDIHNEYPLTWTTSGERLPLKLAQKVIHYSKCHIVNSYGPAEACVYVTTNLLTPDNIDVISQISIGQAILNTKLYILDENNRICGLDTEGEICIFGVGVTDGYLGMPEYNSKVLIENPVGSGYLYKTGDIGKLSSADGMYYFCGRKDNQIKYHGIRVEPEEIEHTILKFPGIDLCKVLLRRLGNNKLLVAYYACADEISKEQLIGHLKEYLPSNIIPSHFIRVDGFDATVNGKLNVSSLQLPEIQVCELNANLSDESELEQAILSIVHEVLSNYNISLDDNFFFVNGDSLTFINLIVCIEDRFKIQVEAAQLYRCETIYDMCHLIQEQINQRQRVSGPAKCQKVRMTDFQKDILSAEKESTTLDYPSHNIVQEVTCNMYLEPEELEQAVRNTIRLFDALYASIIRDDGEYYLVRNDEIGSVFHYFKEVEDLSTDFLKQYVKKFRYNEKSLIDIILFEDVCKHQKIIINAHHAIFDFVSVLIFLHTILKVYYGEKLEPSARNSFFEALASVQDESYVSEKRSFWREYYANRKKAAYFLPDLSASIDIQSDDVFEYNEIIIDNTLLNDIKQFCRQNGCTCFQFILAIFAKILAEFGDTDDVIIGTFVPGRSNVKGKNLYRCVGLLTTCIGIRMFPKDNLDKRKYIQHVKRQYEDVLDYQDTSLREIFRYLRLPDLLKGELFKVLINYHSHIEITYNSPNGRCKLSLSDISMEPNRYPLNITAHEFSDKLSIAVSYASRLYSKDKIEEIKTLVFATIDDHLRD